MNNFIKWTGLTAKELGIISFLLITFCAGLVVKYSGWKSPNEYDYSQTDLNFENRLKGSFEELKTSQADSLTKLRSIELETLADSLGISIENNDRQKKVLKPGTKININTAQLADLQGLPGIGEVMAERIIEYREQHGKFNKAEDLKKVKGIGDKKFGEIQQYLTTE